MMDKSKFLIKKSQKPHQYREISGNLSLQTPTGSVTIPVDFEVAMISQDVFLQGSELFVAPCAPIPNEFVKVEMKNEGKPDRAIEISWAVNSYRTVTWKASGFTE